MGSRDCRSNQAPGTAHHRSLLADERYDTPGYLAEINDMYEQPHWRVFAGACTGPLPSHVGELEMALAVIRGR